MSMGQASEFSIPVEEYDINSLDADITTPSGKTEHCLLKKLPNGHLGMYELLNYCCFTVRLVLQFHLLMVINLHT